MSENKELAGQNKESNRGSSARGGFSSESAIEQKGTSIQDSSGILQSDSQFNGPQINSVPGRNGLSEDSEQIHSTPGMSDGLQYMSGTEMDVQPSEHRSSTESGRGESLTVDKEVDDPPKIAGRYTNYQK